MFLLHPPYRKVPQLLQKKNPYHPIRCQIAPFDPLFSDTYALVPADNAVEPPLSPVTSQDSSSADTAGGGKKRMGLDRGVSVHAERFVRGLDSALDFVDGRVGFGAL